MNRVIIRILFLLILSISISHSYLLSQASTNSSSIEGKQMFQTAIARIHELDTAISYFERAIPLLEKDSLWEDYVNCFNALHYCYFEKDNYERAEYYAKEALEKSQKYLSRENPAYSYALNNLGTVYTRKSDYQQAIQYFEKALEIMKMGSSSTPQNKAALADAYSNIGTLLFKVGQNETALTYLQQCLDLKIQTLPKGVQDPLLAKTYRIIGDILLSMNREEEAFHYLDEISNLLSNPKDKDTKRQLLRHYYFLMNTLIENGKKEEVAGISEKIKKLQGSDIYRPEVYYHLEGKYEMMKGNHEKGIVLLNEGLKNAGKLRLDEKVGLIRNLGKAYTAKGDLQRALSYYERALDSLQKEGDINPFPLAELSTLEEMGEVLLQMGEWERVVEQTHQADTLIQLLRHRYRVLGEKLQLAEKSQAIHNQGITAAYELFHKNEDIYWLEQAFAFSENNKGVLLFESLMHTSATFQLPDSLRQKEYLLRIDLDFQETLLLQAKKEGRDNVLISLIRNQLFKLRETYQDLLELFEVKYPLYYEEKYQSRALELDEFRRNISKGELCLTYFWGKEFLYILTIDKKNIHLSRTPIDDTFIQTLTDFRTQLMFPPSVSNEAERYLSTAWELRQVLLPDESYVDNKEVKHLVIIPDGLISYLPFGSFLSESPNLNKRLRYQQLPYLIHQYSFSYQYSGKLWVNLKNRKNTNKKKGVWAGYAPTYSTQQIGALNLNGESSPISMRDNGGFLPFAAEEVQRIGELIKGEIFLDELASESNFKHESQAFSILHLATHGLLEEENPMYSRLLFSPTGDSLSEDGSLQAYELYNMKLDADLVVLSACNTGSGKLQMGEGIFSISRAFSAAGCKSLLMSLWQVADRSTSELMMAFYEHLLLGERKDVALQKAQVDYFLNQDESIYAHPYYWSGFVMSGNENPWHFSSGLRQIGMWLLWGLGGLLIGGGIWFFRRKRTT